MLKFLNLIRDFVQSESFLVLIFTLFICGVFYLLFLAFSYLICSFYI